MRLPKLMVTTLFAVSLFNGGNTGIVSADSVVGKKIIMLVNSNITLVDKELKNIDPVIKDAVPFIKDGSTLVPLRFISENLGTDVQGWNQIGRQAISYVN